MVGVIKKGGQPDDKILFVKDLLKGWKKQTI